MQICSFHDQYQR